MNTGRNPAMHTETHMTARGIAKGTPVAFTYGASKDVRSNSVVMPGGHVTIGPIKGIAPLTQSEVDGIKSGDIVVDVYGESITKIFSTAVTKRRFVTHSETSPLPLIAINTMKLVSRIAGAPSPFLRGTSSGNDCLRTRVQGR